MTANEDRLTFGQNRLVPSDSPGAWGARLIVGQDGYIDFLPDRQAAAGDKDRILDTLNAQLSLPALREAVRDLLVSGEMQTRRERDFTLLDTAELEVHANTNASAGYCYVTAWLKTDTGSNA